jgi:hypothetical protein
MIQKPDMAGVCMYVDLHLAVSVRDIDNPGLPGTNLLQGIVMTIY